MRVGIIGTGYVGLITGVGLADKGHNVVCFDIHSDIIQRINECNPHIYEHGLKELLTNVMKSGCFSTQIISVNKLVSCEVIIIAVGTPSVNGKIDLKYVKNAAMMIGSAIKLSNHYKSVIVKSTVLPGTTDTIVRKIIEDKSGKLLGGFGLGMNPEFLREGNAIKDFMEPDRIVLGHEDSNTLNILQELYKSWNCEKITVNTRTAEMIKYANNALLATQISTVNELANIVTEIGGIDFYDVLKGVHSDNRWNPVLPDNTRIYPEILNYHIPGCGFGGSCFPKDVQALRSMASKIGVKPHILNAVLKVNENQPKQVLKLLKKSLINLKDKKILLLGLSFKPGTDDVRESVALKILEYLCEDKVHVFAHDPIAIENARKNINNVDAVIFTKYWTRKLVEVDAIVIATKWHEYNKILTKKNLEKVRGKVILDGMRMFNPDNFPYSKYLSIGKN